MHNLEWILRTASTADYDSRHWYRRAAAACQNLGQAHAIGTGSACGIVAALSPRLPWDINIREAEHVIKGRASRALGASIIKARRILAGESPDTVLGGLKVRAFYANLYNPEDTYYVTVDVWAARAWYGNLSYNKGLTAAVYNRIADDYRELARAEGLLPSEVQAIIWELVRRLKKSRAFLGQLPLDI